MAKTKITKLNCADFGMGELLFVPIDHEAHEPVRCFTTPSAVIRANRLPDDLTGYAVAYFSARSQGLFEPLGFEETGDIEEDVLRFCDQFASGTADMFEQDQEADEREQNPTK